MFNKDFRNTTVSTDNLSLLQFLMPGYRVYSSITDIPQGSSVIFTGANSAANVQALMKATEQFVIRVRPGYSCDYRLEGIDNLIEIMEWRHDKPLNPKIKAYLTEASTEEQIQYFKTYWATGISIVTPPAEVSVWDLYRSLGKSRHNIMAIYLRLTAASEGGYSNDYIVSCLLSFLEKAVDPKTISNNGEYLTMLKEFRETFGITGIKQRLLRYYELCNTERMRTLWLLYSLGKGSI